MPSEVVFSLHSNRLRSVEVTSPYEAPCGAKTGIESANLQ